MPIYFMGARIFLRISDSRESPDSRESCESIHANRATKSKPLSSASLAIARETEPRRPGALDPLMSEGKAYKVEFLLLTVFFANYLKDPQRARILKKNNLSVSLENFKFSLEIFNLA